MALPLNLQNYTATIAAGQSLSGAVSIGAGLLVGLAFPTGWTAAGLTFQVSVDGTTWQELYDQSGNEITIAAASAAAAAFVQLTPDYLFGVNMLKLRSGTLASPVNQTSQANIILVTRAAEW